MSSLTSRFVRYLVWAGLSAGTALSLSGCHYTEEQKWAVCCVLYIIKDAAPSQPERATIIKWQTHTWFHGRGIAGDPIYLSRTGDTDKEQRIKLEIANFLADSPGGQASDYFRSLGMACDPVTPSPKVGVTRCRLELPIHVRCGPTYGPLPGTTPIPREMQEPLPALLRMSVDVSADTLIGVTTRIDPVPGGHLCHR
jgi:hypothetical protein